MHLSTQRGEFVVEAKSFEVQEVGLHAVYMLKIMETTKRGFRSRLWLPAEAIGWMEKSVQDVKEAKGYCFRKFRGSKGSVIGEKRSNHRGEFISVQAFRGDGVDDRIIIPRGINNLGWEAFLTVLRYPKKLSNVNRREEGEWDKEFSKVVVDLDAGAFNGWDAAVLCSIGGSQKKDDWGVVAKIISKLLSGEENVSLFPFEAHRAIFHTKNITQISELCGNQSFPIGNRNFVGFRRWWPASNSLPITSLNKPRWVAVKGIPFHLWTPSVLGKIGSICGGLVEVHPSTADLSILSFAKIKVVGDLRLVPRVISIVFHSISYTLEINVWEEELCENCKMWLEAMEIWYCRSWVEEKRVLPEKEQPSEKVTRTVAVPVQEEQQGATIAADIVAPTQTVVAPTVAAPVSLRRSSRDRRSAISSDYEVYLNKGACVYDGSVKGGGFNQCWAYQVGLEFEEWEAGSVANDMAGSQIGLDFQPMESVKHSDLSDDPFGLYPLIAKSNRKLSFCPTAARSLDSVSLASSDMSLRKCSIVNQSSSETVMRVAELGEASNRSSHLSDTEEVLHSEIGLLKPKVVANIQLLGGRTSLSPLKGRLWDVIDMIPQSLEETNVGVGARLCSDTRVLTEIPIRLESMLVDSNSHSNPENYGDSSQDVNSGESREWDFIIAYREITTMELYHFRAKEAWSMLQAISSRPKHSCLAGNLLNESSPPEFGWKQEKLLLAVKAMNNIEKVILSVAKCQPQWKLLLKSVDARVDKTLGVLRPQALADHRALLASLGWPPALLTSETEIGKNLDLPNPLVLMQGDKRERYSPSFLALCACSICSSRGKHDNLNY
ncbi:hypothetical protein HHK36_011660 [Tetracentron sinense]|uniref:DUF4283 domain-containing protein n=1 Tax=Tetracentron sinense TaxID=13715 RepID=A0A834ZC37_TETSI|nr:hypothetical protein HHK36_011660 [Tetracentron sinense]